jgi:leader peptidase (prepilin peptidase)/N-methyltransferase
MSPLSETPSAVASNRMTPTLSSRDIGATWMAPALTFAAAAFSVVLAPGPRGVLGAPAFLLGLAYSVVRDAPPVIESMAFAALRGAVLALMFLALREIYRRWRGREGIGLGDVKLAAVAGAWLDWQTIPLAVEVAALAALATFFLAKIIRKQVVLSTSRVPFGLFLAPAIWAGWLFELFLPAAR